MIRFLIYSPSEAELEAVRARASDYEAAVARASHLTDAEVEAIRRAGPQAEVLLARTLTEALARAPEADALCGYIHPDVVRAGVNLRWVQSTIAGVDGILSPEVRESRALFTNARVIYGPQLADHTMAFILAFARCLPAAARPDARAQYGVRHLLPTIELGGKTLLIIGLGGTGRALAERAAAFGMRVIATRRRPTVCPPAVECVRPSENLHRLLPEADFVAICCPLTPETHHLFGRDAFRQMRPTACLTNVARGAIVDHDALVEALRAGEIAGAGLDVTEPEPLPADHPLWQMENVIITPHTAGPSPEGRRRLVDLVTANLRRFIAGEPLEHVVDKEAGY